LVLALTAPVSAQESPLAQLPADSSFVIQIRGIERTKDRIVAFVKNALPDLASMVQSQLEDVIKNGIEGRHFNGLNKDGPHFVFLTELPMPGAGQPKVGILLRLDNYQDFTKGFLKEDEIKTLKPTKNGYDVATLGPDETYFIDRKDYVLLTPNKDLADQLAKKGPGLDGKMKKEIAKKLLDADVSAYVDMTAVNKEYGGQIQTGRQAIPLIAAQAEQMGKSNVEMFVAFLEGFFQFIEDGKAILLTAEFRPEGLAFHVQTQVGEDTKTNGLFKATKKSSFESVGQLPAGQLGYGGLSLAGPYFKLFQYMTLGVDDEPKPIKEALGELEKSEPESWISAFQMPPQGIQVTQYKDPTKATASMLKVLQGLKEGDNFMNIALKGKPEIKADAQTFKDFKLHHSSMIWDYEKTMENQGGKQLPEEMRKQMVEAMKKLGGDGSKMWFGTDGKSYVQITAKNWETAQGFLNQYLEGKTSIKNQKAYQETRAKLPTEATLIALIDALPYCQTMGNYMLSMLKMVPLPIAIPFQSLPAVKGDPAYLGMAIALESGYGGMDFWLPASAVIEVRKLVDAAMGKK
jgi:hypothetical protein